MPAVDVDPLSFAIRPPPGETEQARQQRLQMEADARIRSNRIDELLRAEREALKRKRGTEADVKLLLLGQAESGKSTLQKQFQLLYAPEKLESERASWRPVVYINVLYSIRHILDALDDEEDSAYMSDKSNGDYRRSQKAELYQRQIYNLKLRLAPLLSIEESLARTLASAGHGLASASRGPLVRAGWQHHRVQHNDEFDELDQIIDDRDPYGQPEYLPSTDDILRCRLQTLGVAEYVFPISVGRKTVQWKLYDVGGSRGQRHAWVPFFEDANAIIFLAPISAFDQYLEEDYKVNRIDDSLQTFTSICANPLLKNVHLVLFLNKIDILQQKLNAGIKVRKYITSFANRPNEFHEVSEYFRAHFCQGHRKHSVDNKRGLYVHMTSVVDTKTTQDIITNVRDSIFRGYLKETSLV
ncbi:hypothetical protein FRC17_010696 [Serendipita sp. 399]|nr:hypothetical protein FRC17_010696 [Serendipita sp. 399]